VRLHEYQARDLVAEYGIPVPAGEVASSPQEAVKIAERLGFPVVIKAQVLAGGRGKAGGVKLVADAREAEGAAAKILASSIKGIRVRKVLVAQALKIEKEYYLAVTVDRAAKATVCILSASGGVDIEELAARDPGKILKEHIDPLPGLLGLPGLPGPQDGALRRFLAGAFVPSLVEQALGTVKGMLRLLRERDCSLVEINPLALLPGDRLVAADAKIAFDDNGLWKHPELEALRSAEENSPEEIEAREAGLSFVSLDGDIGCIVNGAGLAMATMDQIQLFGGSPANFLDVGGSSSPQKVLTALRILTRNPKLKAILVNIFGGITRCDDIAKGILIARGEIQLKVPLVIRLVGTNQKEGRELLEQAGLGVAEEMTEAVRLVLQKAERQS
jgi:succinyl-CoA synthetase beta subunit